MRSEFTAASSFEQSSVLHDDEGVPKSVEFEHHDQPETPPSTSWSAAPSATPSVVDEPSNSEQSPNSPRRREFPAAFIEAFSRDEESVADSPHMGPYLLKLAKSYASGENPVKALEYCIRAVKFYERHSQRENVLDLVISLHILAALHCHLGQYEDASALLERSLTLPDIANGGEEHALAAFSGHMQLGDTLNMVGKLAQSLQSYHRALDIQKSVLGDFDARVADSCVYIAEAHMQVRNFRHFLKCRYVIVPSFFRFLRSFRQLARHRSCTILPGIVDFTWDHRKSIRSSYISTSFDRRGSCILGLVKVIT